MAAASLAAGADFLHSSNGDNDSLLRIVQVRDLIAGQGWFDLTQYRMGLDGGFVMHWSRIVDAPIAKEEQVEIEGPRTRIRPA